MAAGIAVGDMDTTGAEKTKIEVSQRELRLKEKAEGRAWERRYFSLVESDTVLNELGPCIGVIPEEDKTGGIWRYDEAKASTLPPKTETPLFLTPTSTITKQSTKGSID